MSTYCDIFESKKVGASIAEEDLDGDVSKLPPTLVVLDDVTRFPCQSHDFALAEYRLNTHSDVIKTQKFDW